MAWLDMDDSKMDLVIGPNEAADDQLLGIKRSYEALVHKTQATGDGVFAADFEKRYSKRSESYKEDLMNIGLENIPADIRFK